MNKENLTKRNQLNVPNVGQSSSPKVDLKLDWCSYRAAKWAVEHYHYSKRMPDPKCSKIGVWENGEFKGCVIFSRGVSSTNISRTLRIKSTEIAELSRVALKEHHTHTSKILAISLRILKKSNPGLKIILSYADENHGHLGIIYQAGNWIYTGQSAKVPLFIDTKGKLIHDRSCSSTGFNIQFGKLKKVPNRHTLSKIEQLPKWRYMMPLNEEMRKRIESLRMPYPKRPTKANSSVQDESGGALPTRTLQVST